MMCKVLQLHASRGGRGGDLLLNHGHWWVVCIKGFVSLCVSLALPLRAPTSTPRCHQNFSAMRLKRAFDFPLLLMLSILAARSFSIDGGPQKNTPISAGGGEGVG
jgi:hypothetical protein